MALTEFSLAINQVATERGIPVEEVLESIRMAYASAYRRDAKDRGEEVELEAITIELNPDTGEGLVFVDGKDVTPAGFGRIAAQTAKQVILQKIRETEKDVIMEEFKSRLGTIVTATIFRIENKLITVDLGKSHAHGVLPQSEQVQNEIYRLNQKLKVLIKDVREGPRGTEILVSRADPAFVIKLFEQEVPEIASSVVTIEAIAREPGSRTKMAVSSKDDKVDPVGSCVGQKGVRVQSIISELFGEKIDIIPFSNVEERYIASALSPAKVIDVVLNRDEKVATVSVPEDQQSLAIGKDGQNARLANKLTHWKIDIKGVKDTFSNIDATVDTREQRSDKVVGIWDQVIGQARDAAAVLEEEKTKLADAAKQVESVEQADVDTQPNSVESDKSDA